MGKPRDIGIRENSVNQLSLALAMIQDHVKGDDNLRVASTLINTSISHMTLFPEECEFKEGCIKERRKKK